jgi:hypothetical protein
VPPCPRLRHWPGTRDWRATAGWSSPGGGGIASPLVSEPDLSCHDMWAGLSGAETARGRRLVLNIQGCPGNASPKPKSGRPAGGVAWLGLGASGARGAKKAPPGSDLPCICLCIAGKERANVSDLASWSAFQAEFSAKAIRGLMARRRAADTSPPRGPPGSGAGCHAPHAVLTKPVAALVLSKNCKL